MAKSAGRLCVIKKGGTAIAGGRTVGVSWNGAPIDITDQSDSGMQTFLDNVLSSDTLELTIDGMEEDQVLRDIAMNAVNSAKFLADLTFTYPNGDVISGDFILTSYSETGGYEDAQTFTATFTSDGTWTYTPAA
jgi:predicted secreted protein